MHTGKKKHIGHPYRKQPKFCRRCIQRIFQTHALFFRGYCLATRLCQSIPVTSDNWYTNRLPARTIVEYLSLVSSFKKESEGMNSEWAYCNYVTISHSEDWRWWSGFSLWLFARISGFKSFQEDCEFLKLYREVCWNETNSPNIYNGMISLKDSGIFVGKICILNKLII